LKCKLVYILCKVTIVVQNQPVYTKRSVDVKEI